MMQYTVYADYPEVLGADPTDEDIARFNELVEEEWPNQDEDSEHRYIVSRDAGRHTLGKPDRPEEQEAIERAWNRFCDGQTAELVNGY